MKSFKKLSLMIAIILVMVMVFAACGPARTCTPGGGGWHGPSWGCGRQFRGNAYHGVLPGTVLCRNCAREYWRPLDIRNFRIS